jgi:hypothetical protein
MAECLFDSMLLFFLSFVVVVVLRTETNFHNLITLESKGERKEEKEEERKRDFAHKNNLLD